MDRKSPELIEQDMHETRQALTDKVAALEHQVVGTFHDATTAVQDTVQSVKSAVEETVSNVSDRVAAVSANVKHTLDVPEHIRHRPWAAVATATVAGVIAGFALKNEPKSKAQMGPRTHAVGPAPEPRSQAFSAPPQPVIRKPGFFDEILDLVRAEIKQLSETAITALGNSLRQNLHQGIQQAVQNVATFGFASTENEDRPATGARREVHNGITSGVRG